MVGGGRWLSWEILGLVFLKLAFIKNKKGEILMAMWCATVFKVSILEMGSWKSARSWMNGLGMAPRMPTVMTI